MISQPRRISCRVLIEMINKVNGKKSLRAGTTKGPLCCLLSDEGPNGLSSLMGRNKVISFSISECLWVGFRGHSPFHLKRDEEPRFQDDSPSSEINNSSARVDSGELPVVLLISLNVVIMCI